MPGELDDQIDRLLLASWNAAARTAQRLDAILDALLECSLKACNQALPAAADTLSDKFPELFDGGVAPQSAPRGGPLVYTFNYKGEFKKASDAAFLYVTVSLTHEDVRPQVRIRSSLANPVPKYMEGATRMSVKARLDDVSPMLPVSGNFNDFAESTLQISIEDLDWELGTPDRYARVARLVAKEFEEHTKKFGARLLEMIAASGVRALPGGVDDEDTS